MTPNVSDKPDDNRNKIIARERPPRSVANNIPGSRSIALPHMLRSLSENNRP